MKKHTFTINRLALIISLSSLFLSAQSLAQSSQFSLKIDISKCASCMLQTEQSLRTMTGVLSTNKLSDNRLEITYDVEAVQDDDVLKRLRSIGIKAQLIDD